MMVLGYSNRIDSATLTGGSYTNGLPLNNLKTRILGQVARTTDATNASSTFNIDFGVAKNIQVASLVNHNISLSGKMRIRASGEAAATNIATMSEDFSTWGAGSPLAVVQTISPGGTLTTYQLTAASANAGMYRFFTVTVGVIYTASIFVKRKSGVNIVRFGSDQTGEMSAYFDLIAGTVASQGLNVVAATITPSGNGFVRLSISIASSTASLPIIVYSSGGGITASVWGMQLELGSVATSYIPTAGTPVTRPAGYMDSWQSYSYDSGILDVWPAVYNFGDLEWEDDSWWAGTYTQEDISGYTTNICHIVPTLAIYRNWRIDILDDTNPAGYIQLGRVFIGSAWQPTRDAEVGLGLGWETNTISQRALSGTKYFQRRTPYRVTKFTLNVLDVDEAMSKAFEIDKRSGIDGEVLYIQDKNDTLHALRRRFLGTLRELSPIEFPYSNYGKKGYTIEEVL
jgi:hypothetical protein